MNIRIPMALTVEDQFLASSSYFKVKGLSPIDKAKSSSRAMDVAVLVEGRIEYIAPVVEFRFLTSLITLVLFAHAMHRDGNPKRLEYLRERLSNPAACSTPFSLRGVSYKNSEELFSLASEAFNEDVHYLAGAAVGIIRYFEKYPHGSQGALNQIAELKCNFDWESSSSVYKVKRWAGTLARQFNFALRAMRELGFEFQFEEECNYLLSKIDDNVTIMKLDPSEPFIYPSIT